MLIADGCCCCSGCPAARISFVYVLPLAHKKRASEQRRRAENGRAGMRRGVAKRRNKQKFCRPWNRRATFGGRASGKRCTVLHVAMFATPFRLQSVPVVVSCTMKCNWA